MTFATRISFVVIGGMLLFGTGMPASQAQAPGQAPKYQELPLAAELNSPEKRKEIEKRKTESLKQSYDEAAVRSFYAGFIIPAMTTPANGNINVCREMFTQDNYNCSSSNRPAFSRMILAELKPKIDQGNFHPATVTNWIHMIGELDSSGEKGRNRVPYAEATKALTTWLFDSKLPDYLRLASLSAFERHLAAMSKNAQAGYVEPLAAILEEPKPLNRTNEVHGYIQRRVVDLIAVCEGLANAKVSTFLVATIKDESADAALRQRCVRALGASGVCASMSADDADALMRSVVRVFVQRMKYWENATERLYKIAEGSGGGGGAGRPGVGGGGFRPGMGGPGGGGAGGSSSFGDEFGGPAGGGAPSSPYNPPGAGATAPKRTTGPTQPAEVRVSRRFVHEMLEDLRMGMDGTAKNLDQPEGSGLQPLLARHDNGYAVKAILDELGKFQDALKSTSIQDIRGMMSDTQLVREDLLLALREYPGAFTAEEKMKIMATDLEDEDADAGSSDSPTQPGDADEQGSSSSGG